MKAGQSVAGTAKAAILMDEACIRHWPYSIYLTGAGVNVTAMNL